MCKKVLILFVGSFFFKNKIKKEKEVVIVSILNSIFLNSINCDVIADGLLLMQIGIYYCMFNYYFLFLYYNYIIYYKYNNIIYLYIFVFILMI